MEKYCEDLIRILKNRETQEIWKKIKDMPIEKVIKELDSLECSSRGSTQVIRERYFRLVIRMLFADSNFVPWFKEYDLRESTAIFYREAFRQVAFENGEANRLDKVTNGERDAMAKFSTSQSNSSDPHAEFPNRRHEGVDFLSQKMKRGDNPLQSENCRKEKRSPTAKESVRKNGERINGRNSVNRRSDVKSTSSEDSSQGHRRSTLKSGRPILSSSEPESEDESEDDTNEDNQQIIINQRHMAVKLLKLWEIQFSALEEDDAEEFVGRLGDFKICHEISDSVILAVMPFVLRKSASLWYRIMKSEINSFRSFKKLFRREFCTSMDDDDIRDELKARSQAKGEKISAYLMSLRIIAHRLKHPITSKEMMKIARRGLTPKYWLFLENREQVNSLEDMERVLRRFEKSSLFESSDESSETTSSTESETRTAASRRKENNMEEARSFTPFSSDPLFFRGKCFICEMVGHRAAQCPNK